MTEILTTEQIAELERLRAELDAGITPYSDEVDVILNNSFPALIAMAQTSREEADQRIRKMEIVCSDAQNREMIALARAEKAEDELARVQRLAQKADVESKGLHIQVETMTRIAAAREKQFAAAREERDKFRAMAVRLAESMHSLVFEENSDEYLVVREARLLFDDSDIAALLEEESHHG